MQLGEDHAHHGGGPDDSARASAAFGLHADTRSPASTIGKRAARTSARLADQARDVLLAKGFAGARIDDIASAAGVSRATFYTYFPSKRDLLIRLGRQTLEAYDRAIDEMVELERGWSRERVPHLVRIYLRFLDEHGAFMLVWHEAAFGDDELSNDGMKARLATGRRFGELLQRLSGHVPEDGRDPALMGLAVLVMIDRYWSGWRVVGFPFDEREVVDTLTSVVGAVIDSL